METLIREGLLWLKDYRMKVGAMTSWMTCRSPMIAWVFAMTRMIVTRWAAASGSSTGSGIREQLSSMEAIAAAVIVATMVMVVRWRRLRTQVRRAETCGVEPRAMLKFV